MVRSEWSSFRHCPVFDDAGMLTARFRRHSYARHTHRTYAFGVVESGFQTFYCRGSQHVSGPLDMFAINPGDVHDGAAYDRDGYEYRMIYVAPHVLQEIEHEGELPLFSDPVIRDHALARRFLAMHRETEPRDRAYRCDLRSQSRFQDVLASLIERHSTGRIQRPRGCEDGRVRGAQAYMESRLAEKFSLKELAGHVGLSRYHFLRVFRDAVGLPPHAYLLNIRVRRAKELIAAGQPLGQVALDVGFYDQSHLTSRFVRTYGVTPGAYARSVGR